MSTDHCPHCIGTGLMSLSSIWGGSCAHCSGTGQRQHQPDPICPTCHAHPCLCHIEVAESRRVAELKRRIETLTNLLIYERAETDDQIDRLIAEREAAERAIAAAYSAVVGEPPEWSSEFAYAEAVGAIEGVFKATQQIARAADENTRAAHAAAFEVCWQVANMEAVKLRREAGADNSLETRNNFHAMELGALRVRDRLLALKDNP